MPRPVTRLSIVALVGAGLLGGCSTGTTPAPTTAEASAPPSPSPSPAPSESAFPADTGPAVARAREVLAGMTEAEQVQSLFMLHYPGDDPAAIGSLVDSASPSGLIMMGDNVTGGPAELSSLVAALPRPLDLPLLIGIDQEGGDVARLPDELPSAPALADQPADATRAAFSARAAMLAGSGVDVNFGVVADVTDDPDSFIWSRVLGHDPASAAERVAAAVEGEDGVVATTLKHFPGHGAAPGDSHTSVPSTDLGIDAWRAEESPPFAAGIAAGAEFVMMGHLAYTAVDSSPASLSRVWHDVLRDELAFDGIVVSDDMLMLQDTGLAEYADPVENAVRALQSGTDLLLYVLPADPSDVDVDLPAIVDAVVAAQQSGRIDPNAIDDSVLRVLAERIRQAERG